MTPENSFLTLEEAAQYTSMSQRTLRRRIADGELRASRSGRLLRVRLRDLDAMFADVPSARWGQ